MADHDDPSSQKITMPTQSPPRPAAGDAENQTPPPAGGGVGVSNILSRWKREDLLKKGSLASRGLALIFSILAFIIMASNKHGDWENFDRYEEYRFWKFFND